MSTRAGLGQVEHHPRAAGHHQPEAERLDQAAPVIAGMRRQLESHLGNIEDEAVGVGERKDVQVDLAIEIHDEAGLGGVAAEPDIGRDRI